jgi:DNA mismatch repair protein MutL
MIRQLPEDIIREIAAGEVISSPVDVVRELLENALDAQATRVSISLLGGGLDRITVSDNGLGIPRDQLALALEQHATSKLTDLTRIASLGFRGEGLWAIRQSGHVRLSSRPAGQLGGATAEAFGSTLLLSDHPAAVGSHVHVTELFAHLPARRNSLDHSTEGRRVLQLVSRYLLHLPQISLRLNLDGAEKINHAGSGHLEAAKLLWGPVIANRLLPVQTEDGFFKLSGLISRPELARPRRDRLLLAINNRPVEWPEGLLQALLKAYKELLPSGQFPLGVLNLELPLEYTLVHTSPDKSKMRLTQQGPVLAFLERSIGSLLSSHSLARTLPGPTVLVGPKQSSSFPSLTYAGSFRGLYLLAQAEDALYIVDQHAAHERILYEELTRRYVLEPPVELVHPELISLSLNEELSYGEKSGDLEQAGLLLEAFGPGTYRVRSIPAFLVGHPTLIAEVVKNTLGNDSFTEAWRSVLARLACLPAIKAGHSLSQNMAQDLLDALAQCTLPWVCPHGRPTVLVMHELELAKQFGRRNQRAISRPKLPT